MRLHLKCGSSPVAHLLCGQQHLYARSVPSMVPMVASPQMKGAGTRGNDKLLPKWSTRTLNKQVRRPSPSRGVQHI